MSSNSLFGGPRTVLTLVMVVLIVAVIAVAATFLVRGIMGPPEGTPPTSVVTTSPTSEG